jgi:hypothetical protein
VLLEMQRLEIHEQFHQTTNYWLNIVLIK